MLKQVLEYLECLNIIAGKRWMKDISAHTSLSSHDTDMILKVISRQINNDLMFTKALYGPSATIDGRYRKRIARLENRLAGVILSCTLSDSLDRRRLTSFTCVRNLVVGETLLRARGKHTNRWHLLAARRAMIYPELMWYAPPVHYALAYNDAFNGRGHTARQELTRGRQAAQEAMHVHRLLDMWIHISIPLRKKADKAKRKPIIADARAFLNETAQNKLSGVVAMAAARLATTLSQLEGDTKLGLQWLDHSRKALLREHRFDKSTEREYHTQRAFIFNTAHDYVRGIKAATKVVESCDPNSSYWFNAINVLLHLQLKKGEYGEAVRTSDRVISQKSLKKQSTDLIKRLTLRVIYARVLTGDNSTTIKQAKTHQLYPLDVIVVSTLVYINKNSFPEAIRSLHALKNHVDRTKELRKDRATWLLSRLAHLYAINDLSLRACKLKPQFIRFERELASHKVLKADHSVISPLQIWQAIIKARRSE